MLSVRLGINSTRDAWKISQILLASADRLIFAKLCTLIVLTIA